MMNEPEHGVGAPSSNTDRGAAGAPADAACAAATAMQQLSLGAPSAPRGAGSSNRGAPPAGPSRSNTATQRSTACQDAASAPGADADPTSLHAPAESDSAWHARIQQLRSSAKPRSTVHGDQRWMNGGEVTDRDTRADAGTCIHTARLEALVVVVSPYGMTAITSRACAARYHARKAAAVAAAARGGEGAAGAGEGAAGQVEEGAAGAKPSALQEDAIRQHLLPVPLGCNPRREGQAGMLRSPGGSLGRGPHTQEVYGSSKGRSMQVCVRGV